MVSLLTGHQPFLRDAAAGAAAGAFIHPMEAPAV
jgi:hypothetical protein